MATLRSVPIVGVNFFGRYFAYLEQFFIPREFFGKFISFNNLEKFMKKQRDIYL